MLKEKTSNPSSNIKACLSTLTKLFVKEAQYAQITRDEALNACSLVLTDQNIQDKEDSLFNSLVQNQILVPSSKSIFLINNISTQGVLVDLTACYSPLCKSSSCYSPSCPNKNQGPLDLNNPNIDVHQNNAKKENDWSHKIPRFILENLTPQEKKRQLAIEELLKYEDNFWKQLTVIRDVFARPLLSSQITIEESQRFKFHDTLFGNYNVLANHHRKIIRDLEATRDETNYHLFADSKVVGEVLLKHFKKLLEPYVRYASNHVAAENLYRLERDRNMAFASFIEQQEAIEKDFRLTLKGLLLSPIIRIVKYELLFSTILSNSPIEDRDSFLEINVILGDISYKINEAIRNAEAEQRLLEIKRGLKLRRLSLRSQNRLSQIVPDDATLIYEGKLELINRLPQVTCQVFLFSNSLLITREKTNTDNGLEYTLLDKAIPLHMLKLGSASSPSSYSSRSRSSTTASHQVNILSSIRHQLSSGSYHYYRRRCNSENSGRMSVLNKSVLESEEHDAISIRSDDGSSIYSAIYTLSGLKLRHRIRSIKQRIRRKNNKPIGFATSNSRNISGHTNPLSPGPALLVQQPSYPPRVSSPRGNIIRTRLLKISYMADPALNYLFECPSADTKLAWKNQIKSMLPKQNQGPFALDNICSSSHFSALQSVDGRFVIGCGTIWCLLPFTTSEGRDAIALGTRYGLWVAYRDGTEDFKLVLHHNCLQLESFDNKVILVRTCKPNRALGAILIDHIYPPSPDTTTSSITTNEVPINRDIMNETKEFQLLQKSGVISFAVGTLRGEPILCYLRRRRTGSVRLVLMAYRVDNVSCTPSLRKLKEYKPISTQPKDLKIIQDTVYIRSRTEGVEKVNILNWILGSSNAQNNSYQHVKYSYSISLPALTYHVTMSSTPQLDDPALITIAYVALNQPGTGLICSGEAAWPVAEANADLVQQEIKFESNAKSVVVSFPYLIIFSSYVIEIRHLETTALVQAIAGNKIRCVHVSHTDPLSVAAAPIIHVTMLHADEDQTKVYRLYLKEPIAFDE
ncbi:hypothetical protein BDF21DRAFT_412547 [Thamnidium elegans]|nr:hypothetical protein BDF21DRAFT_412547 [Thamnidium elegans]